MEGNPLVKLTELRERGSITCEQLEAVLSEFKNAEGLPHALHQVGSQCLKPTSPARRIEAALDVLTLGWLQLNDAKVALDLYCQGALLLSIRTHRQALDGALRVIELARGVSQRTGVPAPELDFHEATVCAHLADLGDDPDRNRARAMDLFESAGRNIEAGPNKAQAYRNAGRLAQTLAEKGVDEKRNLERGVRLHHTAALLLEEGSDEWGAARIVEGNLRSRIALLNLGDEELNMVRAAEIFREVSARLPIQSQLRVGCRLNEGNACFLLAKMGRSEPQNVRRALELYSEAAALFPKNSREGRYCRERVENCIALLEIIEREIQRQRR
ncbi:MAG: SEL1-like repeat protein [Armatimonadetes bacterium]|nr:SEL1-like repeat protein [Armatimonadota bacterium]